MKRKALVKQVGVIMAVIIGILICTVVVAFISLQVRTKAILDDCADIHNNKKYQIPVCWAKGVRYHWYTN